VARKKKGKVDGGRNIATEAMNVRELGGACEPRKGRVRKQVRVSQNINAHKIPLVLEKGTSGEAVGVTLDTEAANREWLECGKQGYGGGAMQAKRVDEGRGKRSGSRGQHNIKRDQSEF